MGGADLDSGARRTLQGTCHSLRSDLKHEKKRGEGKDEGREFWALEAASAKALRQKSSEPIGGKSLVTKEEDEEGKG